MGGSQSSTSSASNKATKKRGPPPEISAADRAMLDLKNARDRLTKYKNKLTQDDDRIVARAKKAKQEGQTKNALNLLKIRKIKQREVETVEGQLLNVLQMVQTLDSKRNEKEVLAAMAQGKDTLKRMHEETTIDDIMDLMDQVHEENELEREMNSVFEGVPSLSVQDEEAVEAELQALIMGETTAQILPAQKETQSSTQQQEQQQLPEVPNTTPLPVARTTKLPEATPTTKEEEQQQRVPVAL